MLLADMSTTEVGAVCGIVGALLGGAVAGIFKYKRAQDDYLYDHFRAEIVTIKADVALLKKEAESAREREAIAVAREAKCREEMAEIRAELKLRKEEDDQ